ncbi:hypothetical protein F2P81_015776 [Scophthalmus maximus]|uniref:Uncharacterized protein n=1 Tax=Scophthalmus maximus TaxID=52904 RepID=A0A6A4SJB8_SCOMX|nr:hypothetical protein F2P81_015776 [Scophthalmus maximus]
MKFKKFITIMQAAMGIVPLNKRELLPPGRKLWRPPGMMINRRDITSQKLHCFNDLVAQIIQASEAVSHWIFKKNSPGRRFTSDRKRVR